MGKIYRGWQEERWDMVGTRQIVLNAIQFASVGAGFYGLLNGSPLLATSGALFGIGIGAFEDHLTTGSNERLTNTQNP
jgi:hypothetical protein